jgi:hypothetical protein
MVVMCGVEVLAGFRRLPILEMYWVFCQYKEEAGLVQNYY